MIRPVVTNAAATVVTRPKKQLVPQEIDKDVSVFMVQTVTYIVLRQFYFIDSFFVYFMKYLLRLKHFNLIYT